MLNKVLVLAGAGLLLVSAAVADSGRFNQPMNHRQNYGWQPSYPNHNNHRPPRHHQVIPDPKNPASVRDWSKPQAKSVYCIGAGCTLHYPTPQQQRRSHGQLVCNNRGCHR